jgi:biopolymer transport protein ExbD
MRFPRNVKIIRGQFDVAAFVGVLFLLMIFLLLHSSIVFTPGVPIRLPQTRDLPGTTNETVTVAVDAQGQFYFQNQLATEPLLKARLTELVAQARQPLTLVVQADEAVTYQVLVRLSVLAREAGLREALFAVRPHPTPSPTRIPAS